MMVLNANRARLVTIVIGILSCSFCVGGCGFGEGWVDNHSEAGPAGSWVSTRGGFTIAISSKGHYMFCYKNECESETVELKSTLPQMRLKRFYTLKNSELFGMAACGDKLLYATHRNNTGGTEKTDDLVLQIGREIYSGYARQCGNVPCISVCNIEEGFFLRHPLEKQ